MEALEQTVINNPDILTKLCRHIGYLNNFPVSLQGEDLDEAKLLGTLETDDFLGWVLGYPPGECETSSRRFPLLSTEENRQIIHYRLLKPVIPSPQPIHNIHVSKDESESTTDDHSVQVTLKVCGVTQVWWGGDVAVIWEIYLEDDIKGHQDYEALMDQVWGCCEGFLASQGVKHVCTYDRNQNYPLKWYQKFLACRGYVPGLSGVEDSGEAQRLRKKLP